MSFGIYVLNAIVYGYSNVSSRTMNSWPARNVTPIESENDTFFFEYAHSWGVSFLLSIRIHNHIIVNQGIVEILVHV